MRRSGKASLKNLQAGKRLPLDEMVKSPAQRELDGLVLDALGIASVRVDELYTDTLRMTRIRKVLAARDTIRREQYDADLGDVADNIAAQIKPLIQGRRFPEDFISLGSDTEQINFGTAPLSVKSEMFIGERSIEITSGETEVFTGDLTQGVAESDSARPSVWSAVVRVSQGRH